MRTWTLVMSSMVAAGVVLAAQSGTVPPPWAFTVNTPPHRVPRRRRRPQPTRRRGACPGATDLHRGRDAGCVQPARLAPAGPPAHAAGGRARAEAGDAGVWLLPPHQRAGTSENASLAGLPAAYIIQQMADFKSGARKSSEPKMGPPNAMIADAKAATDAEIREAAGVARVVPLPHVDSRRRDGHRAAHARRRMDARADLGHRAAGPADHRDARDLGRTELRDGASGFVAYVPVGAVAAGEALARTGGNGRTQACATCHGPGLTGLGPVPPLAGRSPSYTVRQLFDFQQGSRKGPWAALMAAAVERLTIDEMIELAAYTASLEP